MCLHSLYLSSKIVKKLKFEFFHTKSKRKKSLNKGGIKKDKQVYSPNLSKGLFQASLETKFIWKISSILWPFLLKIVHKSN